MNVNLRHYEESHERQQELYHLLLKCKPFGILKKPFLGLRAMRASLEVLRPFFGPEIHFFQITLPPRSFKYNFSYHYIRLKSHLPHHV